VRAGPEGEALLRRSLALDSSYPGVPAVTLAFILSQRGEQDEAQKILDHMPSPSNMEPQYMMVRSIVLARQGHVAEGRAQWQRLLAIRASLPMRRPKKVLSRFVITPVVIQRASAALRDSGVIPVKPEP
jgi:predicted negative regulator of RcsB-dependent stress response